MTPTEETLMAYVDGELDANTRAAVDVALARDPALVRRVESARRLRATLSRGFDPALAEAVPERLLAAARGEPTNVRPLPERRGALRAGAWSWPQWGAIAASLVLGLVLGPRLVKHPATITSLDGRLVAGGALAAALDTQLVNAQTGREAASIGLSFRAGTGEFCRTFDLRGAESLTGVACRRGGRWQIDAVMPADGDRRGAVRTAGSALTPALATVVEAMIAGDALDANEEAAARARGWVPAR
ncbi:MAG: anti-sigma factor [Steroidobacteraceae bacterium]